MTGAMEMTEAMEMTGGTIMENSGRTRHNHRGSLRRSSLQGSPGTILIGEDRPTPVDSRRGNLRGSRKASPRDNRRVNLKVSPMVPGPGCNGL